MFDHAFDGFPCQIKTIKASITLLKHGNDTDSLLIMIKSAIILHHLIKRGFTSMTERRMTQIMS